MAPHREHRAALALSTLALGFLCAPVAAAESAPADTPGGGLFDAFEVGKRKEPITVTSGTLEYDYKKNVVVYRGDVQATQGPVKLRGDTLTVTLTADRDAGPAGANQRVRQIVAQGNVRIDHGARWATGGKAVFDQNERTLVLSEEPVLHDGANEVAGDRVIVYLDEDRSVVEGGRRRVKAVLHPGKDGGLAPASGAAQAAAEKAPTP